MKKLIVIVAILCVASLAQAQCVGLKWTQAKMDDVLSNLLGVSDNDPLFPSTKREGLLRNSISSISAKLPLAPFLEYVRIGTDSSYNVLTNTNIFEITSVSNFEDSDSIYGLIKIDASAVGQKELATTAPARYYWRARRSDIYSPGVERLYIYPQASADTAGLWVRGYRIVDSVVYVRQIAHPEIFYHVLYLCYSRKGEDNIARAFKMLSDMMVADLQNNLLNRPIDIKHQKRVLPK